MKVVIKDMGSGTDVLVAGGEATTVRSKAVRSTSMILPIRIAETIKGNLRAFKKVEGKSFDVVSDEGGDEGVFGWLIF